MQRADVDELAVEPVHGAELPSHRRSALSAMVSNTGCTSVGDRLITPRISLVAVCCSRDSVSASLRALELGEQAHVLDRDEGLIGEGLQQLDLRLGERSATSRPTLIAPMGTPSRMSGTASTLRKPVAMDVAVVAKSGSARTSGISTTRDV